MVMLDKGYPVATCRFYEVDQKTVLLGRVVVLPEYRGRNIGTKTVLEAEKWIRECGYKEIVIDSRVVVKGFYTRLGYEIVSDDIKKSGSFDCVRMHKLL